MPPEIPSGCLHRGDECRVDLAELSGSLDTAGWIVSVVFTKSPLGFLSLL